MARARLTELLGLPYSAERDLTPFFDALKDFCRECSNASERAVLHRKVYALYDVRSEPLPHPARNDGGRGARYPYNALPDSFWAKQ